MQHVAGRRQATLPVTGAMQLKACTTIIKVVIKQHVCMQTVQQLQDEIAQVQQQATEQAGCSAAKLHDLTDTKVALQQSLDKALLELEASASSQADLTEEIDQWKGKVAKSHKVIMQM